MLLREIELDLPYQKNNEAIQRLQDCKRLDYMEAVKQDYEVNWKEMRRKFQLMTHCMTSMIERIMKPIHTKDCWKILIECVDGCIDVGYRNLLGVYTIQIAFNKQQFFLVSNLEKKKMVINVVLEAIKRFSDIVDFEVANIREACIEIKRRDYTNEWFWKKSCTEKKKKAQVKIIHDVDDVKIYIVFSEDNNLIQEKLLLCAEPDERSYSLFLGEISWISPNEIVLISKSGDRYICNNGK
ncbi:MAG: hypothetical protein K2J90_13985 [Lachnospiraceae bacterium]|nr:hypothetical protein [Lachnospiraceae bacterium]